MKIEQTNIDMIHQFTPTLVEEVRRLRHYNERLGRSNEREMKRIQESIRTMRVAHWEEVNTRGNSANFGRRYTSRPENIYLNRLPQMIQQKVNRAKRRRIKQI